MRKIFLIAVIFTQIISLTANAQQSGPLNAAIQDVVRKAGANKQGPMTMDRHAGRLKRLLGIESIVFLFRALPGISHRYLQFHAERALTIL